MIFEKSIKNGQHGFQKCFHYAPLEDEDAKSLFHEVGARNVGTNEWLSGRWHQEGKRKDGNGEEDVRDFLLDKEDDGQQKKWRCHLKSTSPSLLWRKRRQKITLLKKKVMADKSSSWSQEAKFTGENKFASWRQLKYAKKMDHSRRKDVTRSFCEAALHRKDKKVSWQKSLKGRQKREDELGQQSADLAPINRKDKRKKRRT